MLSTETVIAFVSAALLLAFIPGPDNIFVLTQAAMRGWRIGVAATLGLCSGLIVHTAAVALGVSVIFKQSALAFIALKIVGAGYLLYLAYNAFRAAPAKMMQPGKEDKSYRRMYMRGVVMNITNPKVAIFFLAFLPQFISVRAGAVASQVALLGALFILTTLVAFTIISLAAGAISQRLLKSDRAQVMLNRFAGVVFVGLAAKLALAQR